jgi:hypothetical protein
MLTKGYQKHILIADYIHNQKQGILKQTNGFGYIILLGLFLRMIPKLIPMLGRALIKGWNSLAFYVDETCTGCRIFKQVCPVDKIILNNNKPIWGDNCMSCFAYLHWYPQASIQIANLTKNMKRYHHPEVKLIDIIKQKKK